MLRRRIAGDAGPPQARRLRCAVTFRGSTRRQTPSRTLEANRTGGERYDTDAARGDRHRPEAVGMVVVPLLTGGLNSSAVDTRTAGLPAPCAEMSVVAVLDLGKTNAKLYAAAADGRALDAVATRRAARAAPLERPDLAGLPDLVSYRAAWRDPTLETLVTARPTTRCGANWWRPAAR